MKSKNTRFETSETLPKYFKDLGKTDLLTAEEEKTFGELSKAGDRRATEELVKRNLKLVVTLANRHIGQGVPIDDLIQEGNLGLQEAANRFDPANGARFASYAALWIRKYLNEAVVEYGRIVKLPHNQEYDIYKAKVAGEETPDLTTVKLDAPVGEEGDTTVGDLLCICQNSVEADIEMDDIKFKVKRVLSALKDRDKEIVKAYFGIDRDCALPTDIIAERYGMTNVRVCQIVRGSLDKMKEVL
jgi:RNA polymerase primary sigma factor